MQRKTRIRLNERRKVNFKPTKDHITVLNAMKGALEHRMSSFDVQPELKQAAREIYKYQRELVAPHSQMYDWLFANGVDPDELTDKNVRAHSIAWIDRIIAEFEAYQEPKPITHCCNLANQPSVNRMNFNFKTPKHVRVDILTQTLKLIQSNNCLYVCWAIKAAAKHKRTRGYKAAATELVTAIEQSLEGYGTVSSWLIRKGHCAVVELLGPKGDWAPTKEYRIHWIKDMIINQQEAS